MEEILASIRRIISEEDRPPESGGDVLDLQPPAPPPVEAKAPPKPEPRPEPVYTPPAPITFDEPEPTPSRALDDDLMIVEDEQEAEFEEAPAPPTPTPPPAPKAEWRPMEQETLTSEPVANQTAGALSKLMGSMFVSTGATLDDVVRELLKPMLKQWLDANLPQIVEAEVAKEIDRIRRMAR
jgi:cell pole-organizing protein PopZ